ncbi:TRAP transporter small permease [Salicibibacter cibarius]|uniref:TRAP transporter small permease n=2 Tax=Salicibibacter cibarius TaxID=2743000 RepID=A0A7T6Z0J9_9BACI|nr:TRAP transporter small permease [Salicibibacter cibarius]
MGALAIVMIIGVFSRYILEISLPWVNELSLFLFAWVTFLGATVGIKNNDMAAVRIIVDKFSGLNLRVINFVIQLFILLFSVILFYFSYILFTSPATQNTLAISLGIPMWIPYIVLPIAFLIMILFSINNMIEIVKKNDKTQSNM